MLKRLLLLIAIVYTLILTTLSFINVNNIPNLGTDIDDKLFHFVAYFLLAILWLIYYGQITSKNKQLLHIVIILLGFGIIVEFLQNSLNPNRQFEWLDMLANITGVIVGGVFAQKINIKRWF